MKTNILVIPSKSIFWKPSSTQVDLRNRLNEFLKKFLPNVFETLKTPKNLRERSILDYLKLRANNFPLPGNDLAWWGRLNEIENVHVSIAGNPNLSFFDENPDSEGAQRWPVLFGFKPVNVLSEEEVLQNLIKFDYLLVSSAFDKSFLQILDKAKKLNLPIALIDAYDDEPVYELGESYLLSSQRCHYDLLFKKDLPLGLRSDKVLPLAPMPYPSSKNYTFKEEKSFKSIFFSGADRPNITRPDRAIICNYLERNFPDSSIYLNQPKLPEDLYEYLNRESLIQLSPSGRVWDSFRHCAAAIDSPVLIIPENDCELTWNVFQDEDNCLTYNPKRLDGRNLGELKSKIEQVIKDDELSKKIRRNYFNSIVGNCSQLDGAKYLLENLMAIK